MSRKYDQKLTSFTPEGRLMQIEYAIEGINKTGSAIGILTKEGVVLITQKQEISALLEQNEQSEKIYCLDKHIFCVASGWIADANFLIDQARLTSQRYQYTYRESMPLEQLIIRICDIQQYQTQNGGQRPYGAAFLFAGYDKNYSYQLYSSDPSGNYAGWKATAIGTNNLAANSYLKTEYKEDMTLEEGIDLGLKSFVKTMDTTSPSPKKIEIQTIKYDTINKQVKSQFFKEKEILELLKKNKFNVESQMEEEK